MRMSLRTKRCAWTSSTLCSTRRPQATSSLIAAFSIRFYSLHHLTPLNERELNTWLSTYQYFPKVFLLPPWKEIYVNDAERDHTFEHAEWVNSITQEWYHRCRYQLIEVPKVSVDERCTFVLQALANSDA